MIPRRCATMCERVELAPRSDGARYRRITLELENDGGIFLRFHEIGGAAGAAWGVDDEEITVRVSPGQARRLAFRMIAEHLADRADAPRALIELCETQGVRCEAARWT